MRGLLSMLAAALSAVVITLPAAAWAAAAPNDDFANATAITSLPFSTTEDTSQATASPADPAQCSSTASVWFSFTPSSDVTIQANTFGSNYDTTLSAWTGSAGALASVACNDDTNGPQSQITFAATAGTTYYFMAAACCGNSGTGGGNLHFSVNQAVPPPNDDFANAIPVGSLPFGDTQDLSAATVQPGEPRCSGGPGTTVWYSFTPAVTESVSATTNGQSGLAAYTGSSLSSLSQVGCAIFQPVTFRAQAGTTYYFQVGSGCCGTVGPATFHLGVAADPTADFVFSPEDPSSLETIQFFNISQDPGQAGFSSWAWDFGDGSTSTQQGPVHKFAADGDYTVHLTATTTDGRTGSVSHVIQVRTHDVAITQLATPNSARVDKTIKISVQVQNTRYPETVQVTLSKSIPGGFTQTGSLTQEVPVKKGNKTTLFAFTYTVTSDDQAIGKITFRADANITDHRDAFPADNELSSTPVKVN